jgi:CubicO group peptidase (beta-lactamase class C family)
MPDFSRRAVLLGTGASLVGYSMSSAANISWTPVSHPEAGFDASLNARIDKLIADKRIWNIHGVVILRGGKLAFERYFTGRDNARGKDLGVITFGPDTLNDLRSVSKSIVGLLYGIAMARGKAPPPEAPLFDSFPAYRELAKDSREKLTIHHVLTMTMGQEWDETGVPYTSKLNSEIAMDLAADRYRFILERKVVREPGRYATYSGGATALLAKIIRSGTGKSLHEFAREVLFDPLGMGKTEWGVDKTGEEFAASGLRMTPRDLALVGQLVLNRGVWNGKTIVPASWIERSMKPYTSHDDFRRFGYHWYISHFGFGRQVGWQPEKVEENWMAMGNGGQRLFVLPGIDLAVAITAGNYDTEDQWIPPTRLMREAVLASILS